MRSGSLLLALAGLAAAQPLPGDRTISSDASAGPVAFVDGGKMLAAHCTDGKLRLWDVASGTLRQTYGKETLSQPSTFMGRSDTLATVGREGNVQVWDARTASLVRQLPTVMPRASRVALSSDRSFVATAHMVDRQTGVNTIRLRDASGKELFSVPAGLGGISILGLSPDNSILIAGSYDADVRVWSVRNGELVRLIDTLPVSMFAMSFSEDGKWLATAGVDRTVYVWNTGTWKLAQKISGQPEMISALEFSPDGRQLVTGGFSELTAAQPVQVILWDVASAKQLRVMAAPRRVAAVTFSPDGKHIASSYGSTSLNIWQVPK